MKELEQSTTRRCAELGPQRGDRKKHLQTRFVVQSEVSNDHFEKKKTIMCVQPTSLLVSTKQERRLKGCQGLGFFPCLIFFIFLSSIAAQFLVTFLKNN